MLLDGFEDDGGSQPTDKSQDNASSRPAGGAERTLQILQYIPNPNLSIRISL